ncbi:AAA family ATPase [Roseateles sp. DC23W]|uniref:AAA family ATPase n=1 Tax=Pelomonas dachongensis TaxID=3299029 RepID=A0ABW7ENB5_9BURK
MSVLVALLGAECTGKSTLSEALAKHFDAGLVTEYLREWCATHGRTPRQHEQAAIAAEQAARIEAASRRHALVICDTTPLITALCSEHYFGDDSLTAGALTFQRRCGLTLLCAPDLPWQADGFLRDGPAVRERFDARVRAALTAGGIRWVDIAGADTERMAAAIAAIQRPSSR